MPIKHEEKKELHLTKHAKTVKSESVHNTQHNANAVQMKIAKQIKSELLLPKQYKLLCSKEMGDFFFGHAEWFSALSCLWLIESVSPFNMFEAFDGDYRNLIFIGNSVNSSNSRKIFCFNISRTSKRFHWENSYREYHARLIAVLDEMNGLFLWKFN